MKELILDDSCYEMNEEQRKEWEKQYREMILQNYPDLVNETMSTEEMNKELVSFLMTSKNFKTTSI